eukprot:1159214-Pelagomonas_calceolata.AAC.2
MRKHAPHTCTQLRSMGNTKEAFRSSASGPHPRGGPLPLVGPTAAAPGPLTPLFAPSSPPPAAPTPPEPTPLLTALPDAMGTGLALVVLSVAPEVLLTAPGVRRQEAHSTMCPDSPIPGMHVRKTNDRAEGGA